MTKNRIEEQELTARIVARQGDTLLARLDGRLRMMHPFYPKSDDRWVEATISGFLEFEPDSRRIRGLQLATPAATYGKDHFGVAVRSIPRCAPVADAAASPGFAWRY